MEPANKIFPTEFVVSVSLNQPSKMLGLVLSGLISDRLGRKRCLLVVSLLQITTSVSIHFCTSYIALLVALTLSGQIYPVFLLVELLKCFALVGPELQRVEIFS